MFIDDMPKGRAIPKSDSDPTRVSDGADVLSVAGYATFAGGGFLLASFMVAHGISLILATIGASLIAVGWVHGAGKLWQKFRFKQVRRRLASLVEFDAAPTFITDIQRRILFSNAAATVALPADQSLPLNGQLGTLFEEVFANPVSILRRLQSQADKDKNAVEDLVTSRGHKRLSVQVIPEGGYLWRLEDIGLGPARDRAGTGLPMLTVGRGNVILYMNDAARSFCGDRQRKLETVFPDQPLRSGGFNLALGQDGKCNCLVHVVQRVPGRREVYFFPLEQSEPRISGGCFDGLPVAMLKLSDVGEILEYNAATEALFQTDLAAVARLGDVLEGPGRPVSTWLETSAASVGPIQPEILAMKTMDGARFVQVSLSRSEEVDGSRLIAVLNDATQWKRLEAQFAQSQKMQAIGELAGGIAHDFNNLLTAISGHCDLLLRGHQADDPDYADLIQISQNANRAAALVGQLLAFSRKQTLRPEVLDIEDALGELTHLLNRLVGERVALQVSHGSGPKRIRADRRQLEQVLMNLVVNARDALAGKGTIRISTECRHLQEPLTRDQVEVPTGSYLSIRVEDEGQGIPVELQKKVFEPFFTTKRPGKGTGLGLSMVYGIVKQSGGFVFLDSQEGVGSCFTLLFPIYSGPLEAPLEMAVAKETVLTEKRIVLLVEDEAPVRAFAARALRLAGLSVIEAGSAEEALEVLEDPTLEVDLFLTDVIMPGMDGPTWVEMATDQRPEAKVIFVSGYAEDAFEGSTKKLKEASFLAKPFSLSQLTEAVHRQLG